MLKKTKIKILALIAATVQAASLLSGCSLFPAEEEPSVPALKTPQPIEYSFYRVKEDTLRSTVTGVGKVTSIYYTNHSFPSGGGTLKAIHVTLGQTVSAGDRLMELDNSDLEIEYLQAEIDYEKEKMTFETQENAYQNGSLSASEYRVAQLELESAQKRYEALKLAYENTMLYASVSGKVVYINTSYTAAAEPKEIVAGETMIVIDSEDPKYTYVVFDKYLSHEEYTPQQFRVGETLTLTQVDGEGAAIPGAESFTGTIVGTDAVIRETGLDFISEAVYYCKMENPPEGVTLGSSVKYDYTEFEIEDCLVIPTSALYEFNGNQFVYMLDSSTNLKKEVPVQIGYRTSSQAQVLDGLKVGDTIIEG